MADPSEDQKRVQAQLREQPGARRFSIAVQNAGGDEEFLCFLSRFAQALGILVNSGLPCEAFCVQIPQSKTPLKKGPLPRSEPDPIPFVSPRVSVA